MYVCNFAGTWLLRVIRHNARTITSVGSFACLNLKMAILFITIAQEMTLALAVVDWRDKEPMVSVISNGVHVSKKGRT